MAEAQPDDIGHWLQHGHDKGWISEVFCEAHDGPPFTAKELEEARNLDGDDDMELLDRCMPAVRIFLPEE